MKNSTSLWTHYLKLLIKQGDKFVSIQSKDLFIQKNITMTLAPWVEENLGEEIRILKIDIKNNKFSRILPFNIEILYEK